VRDQGSPSKESSQTAIVNINILSISNSAPVFVDSYSAELNSTIPTNTLVVRVQAVDSNPSSVLTYRIVCKLFSHILKMKR